MALASDEGDIVRHIITQLEVLRSLNVCDCTNK